MNTRNTQYTFPPSVVSQIAQLPELPMTEIKVLWKRLFGTDTPNHNRQFLERRLAHKLQLIEFRKTDRNLLESNERRIKTLIEKGKLRSREKDYRPLAGSVLIRDYQDVEHRVVVEANGQYEYESRRYASLSAIAREITGTRWSGPLFFGLKAPVKTKVKKGAKR
ncbi:DUF2924 domain-containing protein [Nitrosomonas supralitoralis]|uniref:DUF2924 domain-containing protein n=1 Tax=Nitrosomonas supralitoralis TaxID=2116706 RepID=A0A2P7NUL1_9PROT|nr:DUF2924 domain-containing protein [Nitrosomonas supralitoralis]PSJ17161.1 DUF2924 domain-containing protein [Nitrosomonas supralitoralis]